MSDLVVRKRAFIGASAGSIADHYELSQKLGDGSYGTVLRAKHRVTGLYRAVKIIPRTKIKNQVRLEMEINLMKVTDHPHIIKLYDLFEDAQNIYLVMELCSGGELFDFIVRKKHLSEHEARTIMMQLLRSLNYLHSHEICHRDLKPENLLFSETDNINSLKLIDFGLSKMMGQKNEQMTTRVGTPYYISPEVLTGSYGVQCDMWSAGVILYVLICGYPPFWGNSDSTILAKVRRGVYNYNGAEWATVSPQVKDLIDHLLVLQPGGRLTAEQALTHPWMTAEPSDVPLNINIETLLQFKQTRKLQKTVLLCIASQLNEREIEDLKARFEQLDTNGDGMLTLAELQQGLSGLSSTELREIWDSVDIDQSGFIDYSEFLAATMDRSLYLQEEKLWAAFMTFDKDGSGKISSQELREVLGREGIDMGSQDFWDSLVQEADKNHDGEIDFTEFMDMMDDRKVNQIMARLGSGVREEPPA